MPPTLAGLALVLLVPGHQSHAQGPLCTPAPALYANWQEATLGRKGTEEEARWLAETKRQRVAALPDPFDSIAVWDAARRAAKNEHVLWEDSSLMVLVDRFQASPELLVIPKQEMMFLVDAPPQLRDRLAHVAAASSDALMKAAGRSCDSSNVSRSYVNPPDALGVRHLHVHVVPGRPITVPDTRQFYDLVATHLRALLGRT